MATESGDKLNLAASQLTSDFFTGTVRAITIGSVSAGFTLDSSAFALSSPLTVNDFFPLPVGTPIGANEGNYSPTGGLTGFNVPLGPLQITALAPVVNTVSFGPAGLNPECRFNGHVRINRFRQGWLGEGRQLGLRGSDRVDGNIRDRRQRRSENGCGLQADRTG